MTDMHKHQFLWFNLATTGLDPRTGLILEWAVVLAADDREGDMSPVQEFSAVLRVPLDMLPDNIDPFVLDMHTKNGLFGECAASDILPADSEAFLCGLASDLAGSTKPRGIILAGPNPRFALPWLEHHYPRFAACLAKYTCVTVGDLLTAQKAWGAEPVPKNPNKKTNRALPDLLAAIQTAKVWRWQAMGI
jgi:oligoribonuclease (3'-5' exoribonuclease)